MIEDTEANQTYCVKKIPYQNFSVEPGAILEPLDPMGEGKCFDSGTVRVINGKRLKVWTCTGRQLWTYELKVTSPPCSSRMVLELNSERCEAGLLYSVAQNCCISLTGGEKLFVIVKVNMGACK